VFVSLSVAKHDDDDDVPLCSVVAANVIFCYSSLLGCMHEMQTIVMDDP